MATSDRSFSENLDLLIKLLRKLKDKSQFEGMPGVPKMFIMNFDYGIGSQKNGNCMAILAKITRKQ